MGKRKRGRLWKICGAMCVIGCIYMMGNDKWKEYPEVLSNISSVAESSNDVESGNAVNDTYEWKLILVNREHHMPEDYTMELTELSNGESVDSRIYPDLQDMFDTARAEGLQLFVADGYRTQEEQQQLLDEKIEAYKNEGYAEEEAEEQAKQWVALPGTSEHQLGLAVDINADTSQSTRDEVYAWLAENGYKFGFINRYPANKTEITGTIYEPWHYRYVGKKAAKEIYSQGICLEEYIEQLQNEDGN